MKKLSFEESDFLGTLTFSSLTFETLTFDTLPFLYIMTFNTLILDTLTNDTYDFLQGKLILGQKPCISGPRQLARQEVNIH